MPWLTLLTWLLIAAIPVVPVVLRLLAGDDDPRNEITHESSDREDGSNAEARLAA